MNNKIVLNEPGGLATPPIHTTQPDVILRHSISDEELDMLCEAKSDFTREFLWIALGVVGGSLTSAVTAIFALREHFAASQQALSTGQAALGSLMSGGQFYAGLASILFLVLGLVVSVLMGVIVTKRSRRSVDLREKIRERSTATANAGVQSISDLPKLP